MGENPLFFVFIPLFTFTQNTLTVTVLDDEGQPLYGATVIIKDSNNGTVTNAQGQFNAGQVNVIERFNAEINNQRDQFNAQNRLIIDQSNAQWRREIATADTAAVNRANEVNAQSLLGYSQQAYNNLWQYYADNMEWAWTSAENERQRYMNLTVAKMQQDTSITLAKAKEDYESSSSFGNLIAIS